MAEDVQGQAETSEAQIAVHWREEEIYPPPPGFTAVSYTHLRAHET